MKNTKLMTLRRGSSPHPLIMSYQTNPIVNRIKINRGWFQEHFPQNSFLYSNETIYFYKYFLYIKFFCQSKKFNLIGHSIIIDNQKIALFYLLVQKQLYQCNSQNHKMVLAYRKNQWNNITKFAKNLGYYVSYGKFQYLRVKHQTNNITKKHRNSFVLFRHDIQQISLRILSLLSSNIYEKVRLSYLLKKRKFNFYEWQTTKIGKLFRSTRTMFYFRKKHIISHKPLFSKKLFYQLAVRKALERNIVLKHKYYSLNNRVVLYRHSMAKSFLPKTAVKKLNKSVHKFNRFNNKQIRAFIFRKKKLIFYRNIYQYRKKNKKKKLYASKNNDYHWINNYFNQTYFIKNMKLKNRLKFYQKKKLQFLMQNKLLKASVKSAVTRPSKQNNHKNMYVKHYSLDMVSLIKSVIAKKKKRFEQIKKQDQQRVMTIIANKSKLLFRKRFHKKRTWLLDICNTKSLFKIAYRIRKKEGKKYLNKLRKKKKLNTIKKPNRWIYRNKKKKKINFFFKNQPTGHDFWSIPAITKKLPLKRSTIKQAPYYNTLYVCSLCIQFLIKRIFNQLFLIKFGQQLHRLISTKYLLSPIGKMHASGFFKFKKVRTIKNIIRSSFLLYKYHNLEVIMQIMQKLFRESSKKQRGLFELFKHLTYTAKPIMMQNLSLSVRGKINSRPRACKKLIIENYDQLNTIGYSCFTNNIDYKSEQADAQTGSFFLKITSCCNKTK